MKKIKYKSPSGIEYEHSIGWIIRDNIEGEEGIERQARAQTETLSLLIQILADKNVLTDKELLKLCDLPFSYNEVEVIEVGA